MRLRCQNGLMSLRPVPPVSAPRVKPTGGTHEGLLFCARLLVKALSASPHCRKNTVAERTTDPNRTLLESALEKSYEYSFNNSKTLDSYQLKSVDWSNQRGANPLNFTTAEKSLLQDRNSSTKSLTAFDPKLKQPTPDLTSIDWK